LIPKILQLKYQNSKDLALWLWRVGTRLLGLAPATLSELRINAVSSVAAGLVWKMSSQCRYGG
jgi:hypothetical protein